MSSEQKKNRYEASLFLFPWANLQRRRRRRPTPPLLSALVMEMATARDISASGGGSEINAKTRERVVVVYIE